MSTSVAPIGEPANLLNIIERASRDPNVDVAKLDSLLQMQERVIRNQAKYEFTQALAAVAGELEPVKKDAKNPHLGTKYATLSAIDAALRPIYSKHNFSIRYGSEPAADGYVRVSCTLSHASGHSETLSLAAPLDATGSAGRQSKTGVQALGSSVSYLKRYLISMVFNITFYDNEDDDGEASRRTSGQQRRTHEGPDPKAVAWKDDVVALMGQAQSEARLDKLRKQIAVQYGACRTAWPDMADEIDAAERSARERIRAVVSSDWDTKPGEDPIAELIAEVEAMDGAALDGLASNAAWRAKTRDLFPLDADRLEDAINLRKAALKKP